MTRLYVVLICVLLAINGLLLWKVSDLRHQKAFSKAGANPEAVREWVTNPSQHKEADSKASYWVLFIFNYSDCPPCLEELGSLEGIAASVKAVRVIGIMGYSSQKEADRVRESFGLSYPVIADPEGTVVEAFAVPRTPWKVVVRAEDGLILYEDLPSFSPVEAEAFSRKVTQFFGS